MAYKFIVDAQLPPALARYLASKKEDAIHVLDVDLLESSDSEIWDYALKNNLVIISKDEDFQIMASVNDPSPKIIWVRIGNTSKKALIDYFEKRWKDIVAELDKGETLIELQGD